MSQFRVAHDPLSIFSGMSHVLVNTYISTMELAVFPPLKYVLSCLNKSQLNKPWAWSLLQLIHRESLSVGQLAYLSSFLPWATSYGFKHSPPPPPEERRLLRLRKLRKLPRSKRFGKLEDPQSQVMRFLKRCIYLGGACIRAHEQRSEDSSKGLVLSFHPTIRISRIQFWSSGLEAHSLPPGPPHWPASMRWKMQ